MTIKDTDKILWKISKLPVRDDLYGIGFQDAIGKVRQIIEHEPEVKMGESPVE